MNQTVAPGKPRAARVTRPSDQVTSGERRSTQPPSVSRIIPAPTVSFVDSSIRMKLPVARLRRYSSTSNGADRRRRRRPISLSSSDCGVLGPVQGVHVKAVAELVDLGQRRARGVLDPVAPGGLERPLGQPADHRLELARGRGVVVGAADDVPARDVHVVLKPHGHRERRVRLLQRAVERLDGGDARGHARRLDGHLVADLDHAARHLAGVAAVVVVLVGHRPDHPLHGEAGVDQVAVRRHVHVLEVVEKRRALVPGHSLGALDHVVAVQRRDRDEGDVRDVELRGPAAELVGDPLVDLLVPVDEVHLVHAHHHVRDLQQRGDHRVPARLLDHALARVDQDQRDLRRGRARDHVACVLLVARGVGDDELALGRVEVAVGDVDRDPLLPLGAQAVRQEREVDIAVAPGHARLLHVLELVLEDLLGVVEEPADQGRLAVVHRAGGGEADELGGPAVEDAAVAAGTGH